MSAKVRLGLTFFRESPVISKVLTTLGSGWCSSLSSHTDPETDLWPRGLDAGPDPTSIRHSPREITEPPLSSMVLAISNHFSFFFFLSSGSIFFFERNLICMLTIYNIWEGLPWWYEVPAGSVSLGPPPTSRPSRGWGTSGHPSALQNLPGKQSTKLSSQVLLAVTFMTWF